MHLPFLSHNMRRVRSVAALLALGGGLLALAPCLPVQAQAAPAAGAAKNNISLNLVNQPIQTALRLLFTSAGLNNSIDAAVQGNVTIDVNDVSFETALNTLLRANTPPLTYDLQNGVYRITVAQPPAPAVTADQTPPATTAPVEEGVHAYRIPIDHYDAYMIAELVAGEDVSSGTNGQQGNQGGRRGGNNGQNGSTSVLMVPANDVLASGGSSSQGGQQGGFGGQSGGFGGQSGGFGGQSGGFGGQQGGGGFGGF
jgi:hypothetical protein